MTMLEVRGISKAYGGIQALSACGITAEQGKITGLIGPNGSGKTTLFNIITGYERADAGTVTFDGATITNATPDKVFGLGIGRTFQMSRIFSRLSVLENMHVALPRQGGLGFFRRWSSAHERQRALELLDFVGIAPLSRLHSHRRATSDSAG
jgi:ABC-type branched-subunit amino acid transport system ATPase component